jgi:hypothetical protein
MGYTTLLMYGVPRGQSLPLADASCFVIASTIAL